MFRKKFINKLREKYQQGGVRSHYEKDINTIGDSRKSLQQLMLEKRSKRYMQTGGTGANPSDLAQFAGKKVGTGAAEAGLVRAAASSSGIGSTILGGLSKVVAPAAIGYQLYDFYKKGQASSGGRYGYEQNPNYDPSQESSKFGDRESDANVQFINKEGTKYSKPFMESDAATKFQMSRTMPKSTFKWPWKKQTGGMYDQSQQYQEGGKYPHDMYNKKTGYKIVAEDAEAHNALSKDFDHNKMMGGGMYEQMQQYQEGGVALPGGNMQQIPGSDAVQFNGQTHDQGGIMMDEQTEVENGETMDQVNMAKKGGKRDYFFSSHLKTGGRSFADMHKEILRDGGNQEDINMLARMQEQAAGRNPKQVAKLGGVMKYQTGGESTSLENKYNKHEANKPTPPTFNLTAPKSPKKLKANPNQIEKLQHSQRVKKYEADLEKFNASKAEHENALVEYEATLAEWEATEVQLSDELEREQLAIEMEENEAEAEEQRIEQERIAEEQRVAQEKQDKADLNQKSIDLNKKAKQLGIDINAEDKDGNKLYVGPKGGLLPSKLDAFEKVVIDAETELKALADEAGIEYDEDTNLSDLQYNVTDAGYTYRGGMEGDKLPGGKGVADKQKEDAALAKKLGISAAYLEDDELRKELMSEGFTMENWMATLDQDLLEQAGIIEPSDWNNKSKVRKYQQGLNEKYNYDTGNKGLVGEKIFRSAPNDIETAIQKALPTVTVEDKLTRLDPQPAQQLPVDQGGPIQPGAMPDSGLSTDRFDDAAKNLLQIDIKTLEDYKKAEDNLQYNDGTDQWEIKPSSGGGTTDVSSIEGKLNINTPKVDRRFPITFPQQVPPTEDKDDTSYTMITNPKLTEQTNYVDSEGTTYTLDVNNNWYEGDVKLDYDPSESGDLTRVERKKRKDGIPWQAYAGMGAGLIPAAYSLFHKQPKAQQAGYTPGFTSPIIPERGKAPRLARYDYNQDIANVGADVRSMSKYIETSGGGPANMVNKMMSFSQGQDAKMKIRSAETRANIGVQNTEAQLKQQMTLDNLKRSQNASIFNAQMIRAESARKDQIDESNTARRQKRVDDMEFQKYAGMTSLASSLQTGFGDILDYKADIAMADAIGSDTGVYNRSTVPYLGGNLVWDPETKSYKAAAKFGGLRRMRNYKK